MKTKESQIYKYLSFAFFYGIILVSVDILVENGTKFLEDISSFFIDDNFGEKFSQAKTGNFLFAIWTIINSVLALITITRNEKLTRVYYYWLRLTFIYLATAIIINVIRVCYYAEIGDLFIGKISLTEFLKNYTTEKNYITYFTKDFITIFIFGTITLLYRKVIKTNANNGSYVIRAS